MIRDSKKCHSLKRVTRISYNTLLTWITLFIALLVLSAFPTYLFIYRNDRFLITSVRPVAFSTNQTIVRHRDSIFLRLFAKNSEIIMLKFTKIIE